MLQSSLGPTFPLARLRERVPERAGEGVCVDSAPCLKSHCGHHEGHPHPALRATFSRRREKVSVTVTMLATILDLAGRLSPQVVEIDLGRIVLVIGDRLLGDN